MIFEIQNFHQKRDETEEIPVLFICVYMLDQGSGVDSIDAQEKPKSSKMHITAQDTNVCAC